MSIYLLEPVDTQFHRSTLPFDAGTDGDTMTQPLPWPRTVYGAFRALGFSQAGISMAMGESPNPHPVWGTWNNFGELSIKGPFLFHRSPSFEEIFLPAPADLVALKDKPGEGPLRHCVPNEKRPMSSCSDCVQLPGVCVTQVLGRKSGEIMKSLEDEYFLPTNELLGDYLLQNLEYQSKTGLSPPREKIFLPEPRVGIMRSHQMHTADEGYLYSARHYRLGNHLDKKESYGYWISIGTDNGAEISLPEKGVFHLGGERRPVRYCLLQKNTPLPPSRGDDRGLQESWATASRDTVIQMITENEGRFKLFLITPGIFDGKSHPFEKTETGVFVNGPDSQTKARLLGIAA
ncbi:MAG: hypothetical protein B6245_15855, partial [Desulfobacteraceae bacterium 4572_88]